MLDLKTTLLQKPFRCEEVVGKSGVHLLIYPSEKDGKQQTRQAYAATPFILNLVRTKIRHSGEAGIVIGASRNDPPAGSLGDALRNEGLSPQLLSYVVAYLAHKGYCRIDPSRPGRACILEAPLPPSA
jgi:hypothetical protein